MRFFLITFLSLFFSISLCAQFNFKVGYQYAYVDAKTHNNMIEQLNTNNSTLTNYQEMDKIKGFHGLLLGGRYRFGPAALNVDISSKYQRTEYEGLDPDTDANLFKEHFYSIVGTSGGLEFFIGKFSFGGSLDLNRLRIRAENDTRSDRHIILKENNLSSHFFISLNHISSDALSVSFQPFIQVPWTNFDLSGLESELQTGGDDLEDGFLNFGFRVVFQNGHYDN